jgi:predicted nucleic acid-binding protein
LITLDTSALIALANRSDRDFDRVRAALDLEPTPWLVPAGILGEVGYMLVERLGDRALKAFLKDMQGVYTLDCADEDFGRIEQLVERYASLPLGFADASVVACAERNGGTTLAVDRHFLVVAREKKIRVVPEIV